MIHAGGVAVGAVVLHVDVTVLSGTAAVNSAAKLPSSRVVDAAGIGDSAIGSVVSTVVGYVIPLARHDRYVRFVVVL